MGCTKVGISILGVLLVFLIIYGCNISGCKWNSFKSS